ncbi:BZ3500_MvSof-1268-A1-R1_Chr2-2g04750 [Microbotryum saponariae]|uniref:BZ3500_MvSof-1268-A1-R1_Chr2-2g04750 protein n=1 Tax=Microbotryum saponariae TaxID=289078 RepID=A0A2X0M6S4_9BASI|nr:BZ3500_MvSof-1268-A1-R1_Chr2-2g04750 [Microbotryum saponariae]SDA00069.1 BZ3501_MvSof-1269-A2-R1_Chr2-2g04424 [Microbotryum saponariae]
MALPRTGDMGYHHHHQTVTSSNSRTPPLAHSIKLGRVTPPRRSPTALFPRSYQG